MGPFVPDIISNEFNLIVAFFVGCGFGFILEQAGFSSAKKLTGLFYGTDFTVLRVFFTAAITAMLGVILLSEVGLIDASLIYVHPTFMKSAIVGGVIMGCGFVIGGYCPGTSLCGAAIGKIDAFFFVAGGLLGVFAFAEFFTQIETFYTADPRGDLLINDWLGVSRGVFAAGLIAAAVLAFIVTSLIEARLNPDSPVKSFPRGRHAIAMVALLAIGWFVAITPERETRLTEKAADPAYEQAHPIPRMSPDELAFRIIDRDRSLRLIDIRSPKEFATLALPGAVNLPEEQLLHKGASDLLGRHLLEKVFVAENEKDAVRAATLASLLGHKHVAALKGGLAAFRSTILKPGPRELGQATLDKETALFRKRAAVEIARRMKERGAPKAKPRAAKRVSGGCGL